MVGTTVNVERNPNGKFAGAHFSSGGGIMPAYGPNFSSAGGGSLEVHFLDENGLFLKKATYTLTATPVGAYFLGETVGSPPNAGPGTFMGDCPQQAYGYIAYARIATVNVGRGGLPKPSTVANLSNPNSSLPDQIVVGNFFAWCFVADSHGYKFDSPIGEESGTIALPSFSAPTETTPTIASATSTTILAARTNPKTTAIQNNSAANIMISWSGNTLTGITPTSTNIGFVVAPGQVAEPPAGWNGTSAVTCYQTSGGSINTVSVLTG